MLPDEGADLRDVRIYEVGPRDGLQNESTLIPTRTKLRFIELLADAGLQDIEATSFVSPRAIPQLADAEAVLAAIPRRAGVRLPVLVPNVKGQARAEAAGVDAIAVFTAATDAFTTKNIGMTIEESLAAFAPVLSRAREQGAHGSGTAVRVCITSLHDRAHHNLSPFLALPVPSHKRRWNQKRCGETRPCDRQPRFH